MHNLFTTYAPKDGLIFNCIICACFTFHCECFWSFVLRFPSTWAQRLYLSFSSKASSATSTNSYASLLSYSAKLIGSLTVSCSPSNKSLPPVNKKWMYCNCLFEENNDQCRICPPGRHKILMFGKNRTFACASVINIFLWGDVLNLWNIIRFHPSNLGTDGTWKISECPVETIPALLDRKKRKLVRVPSYS